MMYLRCATSTVPLDGRAKLGCQLEREIHMAFFVRRSERRPKKVKSHRLPSLPQRGCSSFAIAPVRKSDA